MLSFQQNAGYSMKKPSSIVVVDELHAQVVYSNQYNVDTNVVIEQDLDIFGKDVTATGFLKANRFMIDAEEIVDSKKNVKNVSNIEFGGSIINADSINPGGRMKLDSITGTIHTQSLASSQDNVGLDLLSSINMNNESLFNVNSISVGQEYGNGVVSIKGTTNAPLFSLTRKRDPLLLMEDIDNNSDDEVVIDIDRYGMAITESEENKLLLNKYCSVNANNSFNRVLITEMFDEKDFGLLVSFDGSIYNVDKSTKPRFYEAQPKVNFSKKANDCCVYGAIIGTEEDVRKYDIGNLSLIIPQTDDLNRCIVSQKGTSGAIWVCEESGPITKGDLIVTSNHKGYGMKQSDSIIGNHSVAKSIQNCDFTTKNVPSLCLVGFDEKKGPIWKKNLNQEGKSIIDINRDIRYVNRSGKTFSLSDYVSNKSMFDKKDSAEFKIIRACLIGVIFL